jgi:hypothetical protein
MSDNLFESLKELKTRLTSMEETYETRSNDLFKRQLTNENIDKKLDKLAILQNEKIRVDAGGKIFETTRTTVDTCPIDSILREKLNTVSNEIVFVNNQPVSSNEVVFIDMGSKDFKLILKIMRHLTTSDNQYLVYYDNNDDKERLACAINYFFKNDEKLKYLIKYIPRQNGQINASSKPITSPLMSNLASVNTQQFGDQYNY